LKNARPKDYDKKTGVFPCVINTQKELIIFEALDKAQKEIVSSRNLRQKARGGRGAP